MKKKWILRHCELDLWPKVTNFNRVWASLISNRLTKTASKSVHPFGWNFVHKQSWTHRQTAVKKYNPSTISWRCNEIVLDWYKLILKREWIYLARKFIQAYCEYDNQLRIFTHTRKAILTNYWWRCWFRFHPLKKKTK